MHPSHSPSAALIATSASSSNTVDCYAVLGVDRSASQKEIRTRFNALIKQWHPDRNENNLLSRQKTKQILAAWAVLGDPQKRLVYDTRLISKNDS